MSQRGISLLRTVLFITAFAACALVAFSLGAVIGEYRPQLAKPLSDWALALLLPLNEVYCNVEDVTRCGVADTSRPEVSCVPFTTRDPRQAILLVFGQSNSANFGETRYTAGSRVVNFNPRDGRCYRTEDPLLGPDGDGGSVWGRLGDRLVADGTFDRVLLVPFGIGGTSLREWTRGGRLHPRVENAVQQLHRVHIEPTHVLWHQGENDARDGTASGDYISMFSALVDALRAYGVDAPVFPAVATICANPGSEEIRSAQRALPRRLDGVYPGADTDSLSDMRDRYDFCHFSDRGLERHAQLWEAVIQAYEQTSR